MSPYGPSAPLVHRHLRRQPVVDGVDAGTTRKAEEQEYRANLKDWNKGKAKWEQRNIDRTNQATESQSAEKRKEAFETGEKKTPGLVSGLRMASPYLGMAGGAYLSMVPRPLSPFKMPIAELIPEKFAAADRPA